MLKKHLLVEMTSDIRFICNIYLFWTGAISLVKLWISCIKTLDKLGGLSSLITKQNSIVNLISWDSVTWLAFGSNVGYRSGTFLVGVIAILD